MLEFYCKTVDGTATECEGLNYQCEDCRLYEMTHIK